MVFQAKVMGQGQTLDAYAADVTKKHAEPLALSATLHALKQFQNTTVCSNRLQVSCRRHIYNGKHFRQLGKDNRTETHS